MEETPQSKRQRAYWRANTWLIVILLSIWAIVSYGCSILFVEQLNQVRIGSLPLGFWFAQQGSIYVFVILIFVYAIWMDRLDRMLGDEVDEDEIPVADKASEGEEQKGDHHA